MRPLIRFSLTQGVLVNVVYVAVVLVALIWAIPGIPVDRYPNFAFGEVRVTTRYPGASPEEVERLVTDEIEEALRGMKGIEFVRSTSIANQSSILVKFIDDTDYAALYEELRLRILGVQNLLPTVNGEPLAPRFDVVEVDEWLPVIQASVLASDPAHPLGKRALVLLGKELRQRLEVLPGVKKVVLNGDVPQFFNIALDPDRLQQYGLGFQEVRDALRRTGAAPPAGILDTADGERLLRADLRFRSHEDVLAAVVRRDGDGGVIRVADLIVAGDSGLERIDGTIVATINGRDAVTCKVLKLEEANAITVKEHVQEAVDEFLASHPDEAIEVVYTLDGTITIKDGLGVLTDNLLLSAVLVMVLLFAFLNRRSRALTTVGLALGCVAAVLVAAIPIALVQASAILVVTLFVMATCRAAVLTISGIVFSFLGALVVFHALGYSINEISLLGFILVTGIVVDDAIVVLENIQRHREEGAGLTRSIVEGTSEVFWPVCSATFSTMAAFLPMLLMTGTVGDFFALVPIAVASALLISLVECLIILPSHVREAELLLGPDRNIVVQDAQAEHASGQMRKTGHLYERLLRWNLRHPLTVLGVVGLLFLVAVGLLLYSQFAPAMGRTPLIKNKFFPDDASVVDIFIDMPPGSPYAATDDAVRQIAKALVALGPERVASVTGLTGLKVDQEYKPLFSNQYGMLNVEVPGRADRAVESLADYIALLRATVTAARPDPAIATQVVVRQGGPPVGQPVNIRLTGLDDDAIMRLTRDLMAFITAESEPGGRLAGVIDLAHDRRQTNRVLAFTPDRQRTALFDLSDLQVQQFVAEAVDGAFVGELRRVDEDIPIRVRLAREADQGALELLDLPIARDPDGRIVRVTDLGDFREHHEAARLIKRDFQRTVTITANLTPDARVDAQTYIPIVDAWLDEHAAEHPGVAVAYGGEAESTGKSFASLRLAFVIGVLLIYGILATQFRSYVQPLLIMSNLIFSFTGVVFALAGFGLLALLLPDGWVVPERSFFTVQVFIAVVGLSGLVVNDAIVLIDFINKRRRAGDAIERAVITGCQQRMRPILMTTATTIIGLVPMAIGIPSFSVTWGPFATSFITGLIFATTMTLLVVPVLYLFVEHLRRGAAVLAGNILPGLDRSFADPQTPETRNTP